jgi:hypothetical protein
MHTSSTDYECSHLPFIPFHLLSAVLALSRLEMTFVYLCHRKRRSSGTAGVTQMLGLSLGKMVRSGSKEKCKCLSFVPTMCIITQREAQENGCCESGRLTVDPPPKCRVGLDDDLAEAGTPMDAYTLLLYLALPFCSQHQGTISVGL